MALTNRMKAQNVKEGQHTNASRDISGTTHLRKTSALGGEDGGRLDEVVARLRKSKVEFLEYEYAHGRHHGLVWANDNAKEIELRRLAKQETRVLARYLWEDKALYSTAEYFVFLIDPSEMGNQMAAADFWAVVTGRCQLPDTNYVRGFTAGAMEVWKKVKDLV